jgi:hypothetical protein
VRFNASTGTVKDNLPAVIAFGVALAALMLMWSAIRPRPESWRGHVGLFGEVFSTFIVAAILSRYAAIPALQRLAASLP